MQEAARDFAASAENIRAARNFVAEVAERWDLTDAEWSLVQIVSELASNALIHAGTPFSVRLSQDGEATRIEVLDGSARRAQSRSYGLDATTGRGLRLVERLSREWGVSPTADGKIVWAVVDTAAMVEDEPEALVEMFLLDEDDEVQPQSRDAASAPAALPPSVSLQLAA